MFFRWALPGRRDEPDPDAEEAENWTEEDGRAVWYYFDLASGQIADSATQIAEMVRSTPETPRVLITSRNVLRDAPEAIGRHIRNTYLKQMQAPAGVKPILKTPMELN